MLNLPDILPPRLLLWAGGALFPVAVGLGSSFTHCAGMCGPIHLFLASRQQERGILWRYHAGRILGYGILGLAAGSLGLAFSGFASPRLKGVASVGLTVLFALFGLQLLGLGFPAFNLEKRLGWLFPARFFGKLAARENKRSWLFPVGLLASLLPCPTTYAVLLWCLGLGNPFQACAGMLALGVSTLPIFAILPSRSPAGFGWMRKHYASLLGLAFLGLSAWRVMGLLAWRAYGAASGNPPSCH